MSVRINLGTEVLDDINGQRTENVSLDYFKNNILISGNDKIERTALLSHILNQVYERVPNIGVLLIKLGSSENIKLYHLDKVSEYSEPNLKIPYFFGDLSNAVQREHFESVISAVFGLHFEMKVVIGCLLRSYKQGKFPSSIIDFMEDLKDYLVKHPYSEEFTKSNVRSIERVISTIQEEAVLERTLGISLDLPEWLRLWSEGKKICVDLSECDIQHQKILLPLLLQIVKNYTPMKNSDTPLGFIAIEDADHLLKKLPLDIYYENFKENRDYYRRMEERAYFLTKEQLEEVFGDPEYLTNVQLEGVFKNLVFDQFYYRNLSLIATCSNPWEIHEPYRRRFRFIINLEE